MKQFRFKQFAIRHDKSPMKVGTDGILLGAWTLLEDAKHILDIGTGTGLIALMLAQRSDQAIIDAIDINSDCIEEASLNFSTSPWKDRLTAICTSLQRFETNKQYDLIVSNPPFFDRSMLPPMVPRADSRHTTQLGFDDIIIHVNRLLHQKGRFNIILPFEEGQLFRRKIESIGLHCRYQTLFRSRSGKKVERILSSYEYIPGPCHQDELNHYGSGEEWSEGYKALTCDFYLKI